MDDKTNTTPSTTNPTTIDERSEKDGFLPIDSETHHIFVSRLSWMTAEEMAELFEPKKQEKRIWI